MVRCRFIFLGKCHFDGSTRAVKNDRHKYQRRPLFDMHISVLIAPKPTTTTLIYNIAALTYQASQLKRNQNGWFQWSDKIVRASVNRRGKWFIRLHTVFSVPNKNASLCSAPTQKTLGYEDNRFISNWCLNDNGRSTSGWHEWFTAIKSLKKKIYLRYIERLYWHSQIIRVTYTWSAFIYPMGVKY